MSFDPNDPSTGWHRHPTELPPSPALDEAIALQKIAENSRYDFSKGGSTPVSGGYVGSTQGGSVQCGYRTFVYPLIVGTAMTLLLCPTAGAAASSSMQGIVLNGAIGLGIISGGIGGVLDIYHAGKNGVTLSGGTVASTLIASTILGGVMGVIGAWYIAPLKFAAVGLALTKRASQQESPEQPSCLETFKQRIFQPA